MIRKKFSKYSLYLFLVLLTSFSTHILHAQVIEDSTENNSINVVLDSIYIAEVENKPGKTKVLHAEPLFIDLIRDLGARKGEKEWNVGVGLTDNNRYDLYTTLVEYEFAPLDRLGVEFELPFSFYYRGQNGNRPPGNKLNSIKCATQYTFLVSDKHNLSLAAGYLHEFELNEFRNYGKRSLWTGNLYNPFFIAAKRWGQNIHTLIYTGPITQQHFNEKNDLHTYLQFNTNFHYMITGTRNFIGLEVNKEFHKHETDIVFRPQMRLGIADNLLIGIVTGIPFNNRNERISSFIRLIYEPGHSHKK